MNAIILAARQVRDRVQRDDRYSAGPFSRVHFLYARGNLHTYRYRSHNEQPSGSLIHTLPGMIYDGGPRFVDIYERTSH